MALGAVVWLGGHSAGAQPNRFHQVNLVSDIPGLALNTDPQLKNPWGISFGPTTPFWVSDAGAGVATLYTGTGAKVGIVVTVPGPAALGVPGVPTGQVFNGTTAFDIGNGPARFIFASATGTISGWNPALGTVATAVRTVDQFPGSSFTGLALAGSGTAAQLFAADFGAGMIDVFDANFAPVSVPAGRFVDPTLPAGYRPFNVQNLGGSLYVTYALFDPATGKDLPGAGHGFVDVFDTDGNMLRRVATDGVLDSPWGLALAPVGFGRFGNDLLVGNLGDGTINAFNPTTGAFVGTLLDGSGNPIVNDRLWGIAFGNGGPGFHSNFLYFNAGINNEQDGLFGVLAPVPEPSTVALVTTGLGLLFVTARRRRS
jgi:uncharacterized protein (TIGR03118 family)